MYFLILASCEPLKIDIFLVKVNDKDFKTIENGSTAIQIISL